MTIEGETPVGLASVADSAVTVTRGAAPTTGDVGLLWAESATSHVTGAKGRGANLGLQVSGEVHIDRTDIIADSSDGTAVPAGDSSQAGIIRMTCGIGDGSRVVVTDEPPSPRRQPDLPPELLRDF